MILPQKRLSLFSKAINTMSLFRYSISKPSHPDVSEKGTIDKNEVVALFKNYDWQTFIKQAEKAMERDIYYFPPIEIENATDKHELSFMAIGAPNDPEFLVFYKRPKKIKTIFGFGGKIDENYVSQLYVSQTTEQAIDFLQALIDGRYDYLNDKIK